MQPDYLVKYEFDQSSGSIATDEETIIIGFSTQIKKGILMQIVNADPVRPEYISVEMNNNGGHCFPPAIGQNNCTHVSARAV